MKVSKRWYDNGSHTVPRLEAAFSASASVVNNGAEYLVTIHLDRESQNLQRTGQYESEHLRVEVPLVEARRLVKIISEQIEHLEYYSKNATWPPLVKTAWKP